MIEGVVLTEFILPIICIACLCVGYVLKHLVPGTAIDRFIPLIVCILGIFLNIWNFGFVSLEIVVTGAVSGLASTGLYELFTQLIERGKTMIGGETDTEEIIIDDDDDEVIGKHVAKIDE